MQGPPEPGTKCYHSEKVGHLARNSSQKRNESTGKTSRPSHAKKVSAAEEGSSNAESKQIDSLDLLYSSSEEETDVHLI